MLIKKLASAEDWSNAFEVMKVLRPILEYVKQVATDNKSGTIFVHSRLERKDTHRFYNKNGFSDYSLGLIYSLS
jgi:hypothetical protein